MLMCSEGTSTRSMVHAQRPEGLNSETEVNFGWFSAELAGSGGTVSWNQAQGGLSP